MSGWDALSTRRTAAAVRGLDERIDVVRPARKLADKAFPTHWTFLLGEVAALAFGILVLTGIFLTLFYRPSAELVTYEGSSLLHAGRELPAAYESVVRISHDVPGGLLIRRVHRVTAHVFVIATFAHFLRIVISGAFRRPREINYHVGLTMLFVAVASAYSGHLLPFDVIGGTSLRMLYSFLQSIPFVGEQLALGVFGGPFPTGDVLGRLFATHTMLLPGLMGILIAVHIALVVRQSHTQFPRTDIDGEHTIAGEPLWPSQMATMVTLTFGIVAVIALSAAVIPWSDVDLHGPFILGQATNASQPDWYLFWVEGALRLLPAFEWQIAGTTISQNFVAGVALPLGLMALAFAYPWIERHVIGDDGVHHHVLQAPSDVPFRLGIVTFSVSFLSVLSIAAGADVLARIIDAPVWSVLNALRVMSIAVPLAATVAVWLITRAHARGQERPR